MKVTCRSSISPEITCLQKKVSASAINCEIFTTLNSNEQLVEFKEKSKSAIFKALAIAVYMSPIDDQIDQMSDIGGSCLVSHKLRFE